MFPVGIPLHVGNLATLTLCRICPLQYTDRCTVLRMIFKQPFKVYAVKIVFFAINLISKPGKCHGCFPPVQTDNVVHRGMTD